MREKGKGKREKGKRPAESGERTRVKGQGTRDKGQRSMPDLFDIPFEEDPEADRAPAEAAAALPRSQRRVLTVSELTSGIRTTLESGFGELWVEGEISNCRVWNTGHVYFTLKDAGAQLKSVMFRSAYRYLKFKVEDGLHVVARGQLERVRAEGRVSARLRASRSARSRRAAAGLRTVEAEAAGGGALRRRQETADSGVAPQDRHRDLARRCGAQGHPQSAESTTSPRPPGRPTGPGPGGERRARTSPEP